MPGLGMKKEIEKGIDDTPTPQASAYTVEEVFQPNTKHLTPDTFNV